MSREEEEIKRERDESEERISTCPRGVSQAQVQMSAFRRATCFEGPMAQTKMWRDELRKMPKTVTKKGEVCEEGE